MPKDGYHAVPMMRRRSHRGGKERPDYGLTRHEGTMASLADEYLERLRVLNRTEAALKTMESELRPFLIWAEERDLLYPSQITRTILEGYQRWLWAYRKKNGKPLGIGTQRMRLQWVMQFFAWLCRQRILEANPASDLELPKSEKRLPIEALTISEVEIILSQPDISDPLGIRDRAMLELFYSTAIRRFEMVGLEVPDLSRERRLLRVRLGKGRKDRVVPVGLRALQWVEKYLDDVRPLLLVGTGQQALFISGYGEPFNKDFLSRKVMSYFRKAEIGRRGGPHLLRHTCATHLLEGGADIRYIQQLLGHEKLETTAIYTEVNITQLQEVHERCHPAEKGKRVRRVRVKEERDTLREDAPGPTISP
jgi:integrase/recombinase XerD